jgi:hypothetical protein
VLKNIPEDIILPTRPVLTDKSMEYVAKLLENNPEPTKPSFRVLLNPRS